MSISSMDEFEEQEDEEELLQRALEEQAQRDLHYAMPLNHPPPLISPAAAGPPSRQPPPAPPPRRPPPPRPSQPQPQPPPHDDDDEESDVELLSLSSEDDDPDNDDSRYRRRPAASHQAEIDDDLEWDDDDEEPDSWKRVDESELSRMVREMREAKLTAAPNLRRAPTYGRKASIVSEAFPRGDDFIDPLGLGVIDIRSLTLVMENSVSSQASFQNSLIKDEGAEAGHVSAAKDPAFREKILYHSENFDPKLFLSHIHQNTGHTELETGEQSLKMDLQNRKQQLKQLVKENFDCFISCKNTIDDIHLKLQQIEADTEGAGTVHLSNSIYEVDKVANRAFGPLFERQVQAERIRSVQGMLQRFRTLFNLPSTIRAYITKGEYDLAVREYKKAKSLVLPTHVRVLKRVLEEVEKVISEFKDKMFKSMEDPNVDFSQLESTIRLLLELEPGSDPVWHYLTIQNSRIQSVLEGCSMEHDERMDKLQKHLWAKAQSDARWKQLQQESNKTSDVDYSLLFGEQERESADVSIRKTTTEQSDVLLSRLIRRLTMVVVQYVPPFWRLAVAIFNGKFGKVSQGGLTNGCETQNKYKNASGQQGSIDGGTDANFCGHSFNEVVAMVIDILTTYESKVLNAFLALTEANVLGPYMQKAVEEISKACLALENKDAAPPSAVQVLCVLKIQVTQHFILRLCSFIQATTLKIGSEEDWLPVSTIERACSQFAISALPLHFQDMLMSTMDPIKEMLERLKLETSEVHDLSTQVHQMQDSVKTAFYDCSFSLKEILDEVALNLSEHCQALESGTLNDVDATTEDHFTGLQAGVEVANPHQKLLMVLSNVGYCKTSLVPDLLQKYQQIWSPLGKGKAFENSGSNMTDKLTEAFSASEESLLGHYTRAKAALIGTAAAAYFLEDGLQWGAAPPVKGIRDAAVELLHPLITVHAELYAGAKPYLDKAIAILIEGLMYALLNVFNENKLKALRVVDLNGFSQLALELSYLETVLQCHFTTAAHDKLVLLRDQLKEKVLETLREAETLGHRRSSRGVEDGPASEERLQNLSMSSEELNALEQQICGDFLQLELRRTRLNTVCFTNGHELQQPDPVSDGSTQSFFARSVTTAGAILNQRTSFIPGSNMSRHRRRVSGSSLSDSDSGKPSIGHPPQSPLSQSGYASSDVGSETGNDIRLRSLANSDRYIKAQGEVKRPSRRAVFGTADDDLR